MPVILLLLKQTLLRPMNRATPMNEDVDQEFRGFRKLLTEVLRAALEIFSTHCGNSEV